MKTDNKIKKLINSSLNSKNALLLPEERILLFSLVYALKPKKILEVGSYKGGSTEIIFNAIETNKDGEITIIDKTPKIPEKIWNKIKDRANIYVGDSFDIINKHLYNQQFDLIIIDGDHSYSGVLKDSLSSVKLLKKDGYLLYHDCYHESVNKAINYFIKKSKNIFDCGIISKKINKDIPNQIWGGYRLLKKNY